MKRRRPGRRSRCIGRRRKHTVAGDKDTKKKSKTPKFSPPEPPRLCPWRTVHHKSVVQQTIDMSGEALWRSRRVVIYVFWSDVIKCPPPSSWKGKDGDIYAIIDAFKMPKGSYKTVFKVLEDVWVCHGLAIEYDGDSRQVGCDPHNKPIIMPGSVAEQIVADSVEDNVSYTNTMHLVNSHIKAVHMGDTHVGRSSIKTAVDRLRPKIGPIKSASQQTNLSPDSPLGKARYEQCQQYRLRLGRVRLEDLCEEDRRRPAFINMGRHQFSLEQVSFWDETHPSCRIGGRAPGPQSNIQRQFLRDINTGKLVVDKIKGINGNYETPQRWGKVKYAKEIRLSLGCYLHRDVDGVLHGRRLPTYDYTNKWVVTITDYESDCIPKQIRKVRDGGSRRRCGLKAICGQRRDSRVVPVVSSGAGYSPNALEPGTLRN